MSNITGLAFAPILLAPLIVKLLDENGNGKSKGWSRFKDKTSNNDQKSKPDLSYYKIGDKCGGDTGKLLRDGHRCIHGIVQPVLK